MTDLASLAVPFIRLLPPEPAHKLAIKLLMMGPFGGKPAADPPSLGVKLWGLDFPNPVGLAAGFDKDAEVCDAMLSFGFGFTEAGTVTPRPQPGNPKPRLFRLSEDEAVINRFGFNSKGLAYAAANLAARKGRGGIVGANVGKNRETADDIGDFVQGVRLLAPLVDYVVCNISSPNTPGLRALQRRSTVIALIERLLKARAEAVPQNPPPLIVKIAPDLNEEERADLAEVAVSSGIDGLMIGNTTLARPPELQSRYAHEPGGLSGKPLFEPSTEVLADMYRLTKGRIPLIGAGGIASGADAYAKIRAGASLVQFYSAMVFHGPGLAQKVKRELAALLARDGCTSVSQAVGAATKVDPRATAV